MESIVQQIEQLISVLKKQQEWGTYYMGKYYFTIATNKKRTEVGLTETNTELDLAIQKQLQKENYAALFHEYIHYLHELSTVISNAGLGIDLLGKAIFTNWLDKNPTTATSNGYTNDDFGSKYAKVICTQGVLFGNGKEVINGKFVEVKGIDYVKQEVYFPHDIDFMKGELSIPKITFSELDGKVIRNAELLFGKYFIYEGLAYELDRIVDMQVKGLAKINDESRGTEYTVMRKLALYLFPEIEKNAYLCIGSMALQYVDCGRAFINMISRLKDNFVADTSQADTIRIMKQETSELLNSKRDDFRNAQEEYKNIFFKRKSLSKAFSFLTEKMKMLYDERIINPTFEIDYVFANRHADLLAIANICDYMYLFTDNDDYMRDFLGTSMDQDISLALKALLAYDDYYKAHLIHKTSKVELTGHMCPFFRCCNLELRKSHSEKCKTKPWRIFEVSASTDNQYCWYGQGVLETKGINEN